MYQWDSITVAERTDPDQLQLDQLVEVNGRLHAKVLAKAAILEDEGAKTNLLSGDLKGLIKTANSLRRPHITLRRVTAMKHRTRLTDLISQLDAAIEMLKQHTNN